MASEYRGRIVFMALALTWATACTSRPDDEARLGRPVPDVNWVNSDAHWVSQPRTVGGRFVAYLERNGLLSVAAVDATTGELAWEIPASVSGLTSGVEVELAHDDRLVYFGTPVDARAGSGPAVFVVAVDAASGTEVWRTAESLVLGDSLYPCQNDGAGYCASEGFADARRRLRIAKATGQVTTLSPPDAPAPKTERGLGAGLYDLGGRDPELIAAIDPSGRTLWTKTTTELFQGRPVTSDQGWSWDRYGDLLVGSLGRFDLDPAETDLAQASIAGVDAATGAVVWIDDGAELGCGYTIAVSTDKQPIRCRETGTLTNDPDDPDDDSVVTGLSVVMERFDPATGATVWQADLGAAISVIVGRPPLIRMSPTEFAVGRQDGSSLVVDIVTGKTRTPASDEAGWCVSSNVFRDSRTIRDPYRRRGEDYLTQCRADGSSISVLASSPHEAGAKLGQIFAWVDASGMHATTTGWVRW